MCNFRAGQKVVYIGTDREFDPNPGKTIHTIQGLRKGFCSCSGCQFLIDVGKRINSYDDRRCPSCGRREKHDGIRWKGSYNFRPCIEDYTEAEIESVNIDELVEPEYEHA